jgi:acyl dehydratase
MSDDEQRVLDHVLLDVEAGKIGEFARASRVTDAVHRDAASAGERGLPAVAATLTHSVALAHQRDQAGFVARLGLDIGRVVVGEVEWEYRRPLVAGDRLDARRVVVDDSVRAGSRGTLRLVTLRTELVDPGGAVVATVREVLIERGLR